MPSPTTYTDSEIINLLREGNTGVFKSLYKAHFGLVKHLVTHHGGTEENAEAVFVESIFILYTHVVWTKETIRVKIKIILYSIARNIWYNEQRKQGFKPKQMKSYERFIKVDMSAHGLLTNAEDETFTKVQKSLRILGEKCQQILSLYYFHHKNFEHIASTLELEDTQAARSQKYRCIQNLKRML